jgi:hypothetical protein
MARDRTGNKFPYDAATLACALRCAIDRARPLNAEDKQDNAFELDEHQNNNSESPEWCSQPVIAEAECKNPDKKLVA